MKQGLLSVSLLVLLLLHTSCASRISEGSSSLPPVIEAGKESQKYNIQIDFMKHHFSGMLIVRRMQGDEIRILASTYFGLSLFDFSFQEKTFCINSCIEPMKKEKILKLLEMDFRNLFLNGQKMEIKKKDGNFEKRTCERGFAKSVLYISKNSTGNPSQVRIKHPWIRLVIQLDGLKAAKTESDTFD